MIECKLVAAEKQDIIKECQQCFESECLCSQKKTVLLNKHQVISYSIIFVSEDMKVIRKKVFSGLKPVDHLIKYLQKSERPLWKKINRYKNSDPFSGSSKNKEHFIRSSCCYFCGKSFPKYYIRNKSLRINLRKVAHHCHLTGKYIGKYWRKIFWRSSPNVSLCSKSIYTNLLSGSC